MEIEIVENVNDNLSVIDLVPEVRERHLRGYSPWIPYDVLKDMFDSLLEYTRLSQRSPIPEINVNNALILLKISGHHFVVGIDRKMPEEHNVILPFAFDIDMIEDGSIVYSSGWPEHKACRPLYVKVFDRSGTEKKFDLTGMTTGQVMPLFSWASEKYFDKAKDSWKPWITFAGHENIKKIGRPPISDSEYVALARSIKEITGREYMIPKEIFRICMSIDGFASFVDRVTLGQDTKDLFDNLRYDRQVLENRLETKRRDARENYEKQMIIYYASSRLDKKKYDTFMKALGNLSGSLNNLDSIKALLSLEDLSLIQKAIESDKKMIAGMANNTCPHRKIISKISRAISSDEKKEFLQSLRTYLPGPAEKSEDQEIIPCTKCKYPMICPHELIMQTSLSERRGIKEIRESLESYIYPDKIQGNYVCRICSQVILSISAFDAVVDQYEIGYEDDPEISSLWSEVSFMTKNVTFENLVSRNSFVNNVVSLVWPVLQDRVAKIMSSRGLSADEMLARKKINSSLFIMAAFINLSVSSSMSQDKDTVKISLNYPKDTAGKDHNSKMFNYAIDVIFNSLSVHVRKIPGLTKQMLVNDLLEAYKMISSRKKGPVIQVYDSESSTGIWLNNSWFRYLCRVNLKGNESLEGIIRYLDKVAPFKGIEGKKKSGSREIKVREYIKQHGPGRVNNLVPSQTPEDVRKKYAGPFKSYFDDSLWTYFSERWAQISKATYSFMVRYHDNIYMTLEVSGGKLNDSFDKLNRDSEYLDIMRAQELALRLFRYQYMKNFSPVPDKNRYYTEVKSPLGYIYTNDGLPRNWSKYGSWSRPAGKKSPWTLSGNDTIGPSTWVDSTGYKYGDKIPDDKDIIEAIKKNEEIMNMVAFYEFVCPVGDLHDFEGNSCKKCSYKRNPSIPEKKTYFDKYQKEYKRDKSIVDGSVTGLKKEPNVIPERKPVKVGSLDFNRVIEAAKYCEVPVNVISSLGSYENVPYKSVQDGKFTAPVTTNKFANRPDRIRMACMLLISRYGSLVNLHNAYVPNKELLAVLGDSRVPKSLESLESFSEDFMEKYETVFFNNGPKDIIDFCLSSFVDMVLKIRGLEKEHPELSRVFRWIVSGPLEADRLSTKPNITSWSTVIKLMKEQSDENFDGPSAKLKETDEDEDNGDGMDMEYDDDEKNIDGDDGNQIKLRGE